MNLNSSAWTAEVHRQFCQTRCNFKFVWQFKNICLLILHSEELGGQQVIKIPGNKTQNEPETEARRHLWASSGGLLGTRGLPDPKSSNHDPILCLQGQNPQPPIQFSASGIHVLKPSSNSRPPGPKSSNPSPILGLQGSRTSNPSPISSLKG